VDLGEIRITVEGGMDYPLPKMVPVEQVFPRDTVIDVAAAVRETLGALPAAEWTGKRIAITAGSRGIPDIAEILGATVKQLRDWGAEPFIVPAMGSHGGATAEGQIGVLRNYGVTEDSVGAPIHASMDVVEVAALADGTPLYCDRIAHESDGIVVCNKIKPHASYKGPHESGLFKMLAIGLGKHKGAVSLHKLGFGCFRDAIPEAGHALLQRLPIVFGLGILENAFDGVAHVEAIVPERIPVRETELLEKARSLLGRLLMSSIDVLIVDRIGKNYGGSGMDTNVTGRPGSRLPGFPAPPIQKIVVRDLSDETHGNATGIGMADYTTRHCFGKIDLGVSYTNAITATLTDVAKIPLVLENDRQAIIIALKTCNNITPATARVVRIPNTKKLEKILVSEAYLPEIGESDVLKLAGESRPLEFDELGCLLG
jgi:hypothetical protein